MDDMIIHLEEPQLTYNLLEIINNRLLDRILQVFIAFQYHRMGRTCNLIRDVVSNHIKI